MERGGRRKSRRAFRDSIWTVAYEDTFSTGIESFYPAHMLEVFLVGGHFRV